MAKNQELELSILIGGHVDNSLAQAVKLANTQIGSIANGASKFAENIAKGAVAAAGGIAAAVVDTTKESVSFESEMLDVTKYVSGLTDDSGKVIRSNYEEMSKDILDLSTDIPYTAEELTRLAAAAGQSGKSMDDLISDGFLRDVAEMGTAMDISADQAGDWAAKWEVAFDINHDQVMELADQINYLGAHYATTAAEIAQTVNDTGSLGQIAGMDVASTAALSTALLAMGVDSGKVATSIRRMYTNLSMGSKATDAQAAAFEQLGFTAEQFAKDMQTDAPAAIKSLFTAIGSQPKDKQVGYLKTLLGQWAIESGAKLTGNLDLFIKTLDDVGDASKYNGSMYKEFLLKCETSESVLTMLSNAWRAVRIEVGNNFLPILKDVAGFGIEKINDFRAALPDITARVKEVIEYLLNNGDKVAATLGGIGAAWAGTLVDAIPYVAAVENTDTSSGGADVESDDSLTRRIWLSPTTYSCAGPKDAYEFWAMSFRSDVESAIAVSPRDVACTVYIFFMLTGGKMPSEKDMSEMQTYLMNEARRPMTDRVICKAPEEVEYSIDFTYYIGSGNSKGASIVQESVAKAVEEFQEWQRSIGRDINPMELIARLRAAGVKRVELRQPVDKVIENGMDSGKAVVQIPKLSGTPTIIYGGIEDD